MLFQTCKTFVFGTQIKIKLIDKIKIFDAFRELSDPPIDSKDPNTIKVQKRRKEIKKKIYVTSEVQL